MENFIKYFRPSIYWILTIVWLYILIFYLKKLKYEWKQDKLLRLLLFILSLDAFRTLFESIYFGVQYTSLEGLLPIHIFDILAQPQFIVFPKIINLITAALILVIIIHKWLPSEIIQKNKIKNLLDEQKSELVKINKKLVASTNALKENEYLYKETQLIAKIGGWSYDVESKETTFTETIYDIYGKKFSTAEEGIESYHPDDKAKVVAAFNDVLTKQQPYDLEVKFINAQGDTLFVRTIGKPSVKDGKVVKIYGNLIDITAQKKAEDELKLNRLLLRNVLDMVPVFICAKNLEGRFILVNKKLTDFYGSTVETMTNALHADLCEDQNELCTMLADDREVIERGKVKFIPEETMANPDGSSTVLETYKIPFTALDEPAVLIASIDITERKQAQDKLKESEEKYRLIDNASVDYVYSYDIDGKFTHASPSLIAFFAVPLEEILGKTCRELNYPEESCKKWDELHRRVYETDATVCSEVSSPDRKGELCYYEIILNPLHNADNSIIGIAGVTRDITKRKRAEKEQEVLQDQLLQSQKMESVGRLAGGVAHDYNNISSVILGYAELVLSQLEQRDPLHGYVTEIITAVKRSSEVTQQLLAFPRKQTIAPKVVDLNDSIEHLLKMLQRLIGEDIGIVWIPGVEIRSIKIDPTQINQIMVNLCVNARDAIANVGRLTVATKNITFDEDDCTRYDGCVPGEYVELSVSDDGSGMTPETRDKIFEPFFTTKGIEKGSGLGLATVYGIVKQNKGFINVYSEMDEGTIFKIYLPIHVGQTTEVQSEKTIELPLSRGETLLLVEDDDAILKMVKKMLEKLEYTVLFAISPVEAATLAAEHAHEINLLITDVVMPEMNGRELSENLQTLYPHLKTLFMSGYTADIIAHRGVLEGDVSFIEKPFSKKELAFKIREVLDV